MSSIILADILNNAKTTPSSIVAASRLEVLGLPTKKSEEYRYFDVESYLNKEYMLADKQEKPITEAAYIEIVDGVVEKAPKGLKISYVTEREVTDEHFDPLYYVGHLLCSQAIQIELEDDTNVKILHRYTQQKSLIPYRVVVKTAPNITVTLSESFIGCDAQESLVLYGCDIYLQRDARLSFIKDETLVEGIYTPIHSHFIHLEQQSSADLFSFDFGNADGLQLIQAKLLQNSHFNAHHLLYTKGTSKRGTVSKIIHAQKDAKSSQKAKNILGDKGRGIFDALIKIEPDGGGTKAYQNSQAILLNDGAYMVSKPQLEIYIDDVEASHGSTIGELDPQQLFYLRSRGIRLEEARKMLILAFTNEIIDAIEDEKVREAVHLSFEHIYYGQGQLECIATCHHCSDEIIGG